jgi:hypothetical protein
MRPSFNADVFKTAAFAGNPTQIAKVIPTKAQEPTFIGFPPTALLAILAEPGGEGKGALRSRFRTKQAFSGGLSTSHQSAV